MTMNAIRRVSIPALAAAFLTLGACDDPTIIDDDHFDVEGFAIFEGNTELYRYMLDDGTPPPLTLEQRVHEVGFVPLDHDGNALAEDEEEHDEGEHELRITIGDTGILTWTPEAHGDEDAIILFLGELTGVQEGSTTMIVCVPHEDHCDFETPAITVNVTAP